MIMIFSCVKLEYIIVFYVCFVIEQSIYSKSTSLVFQWNLIMILFDSLTELLFFLFILVESTVSQGNFGKEKQQ